MAEREQGRPDPAESGASRKVLAIIAALAIAGMVGWWMTAAFDEKETPEVLPPPTTTATPTTQGSVTGDDIPTSGGGTSSSIAGPTTSILRPTTAPPTTEVVDDSFAVRLYDTAWDAPFYASMPEIETYFDHLAASGYTGAWMALVGPNGRRDGVIAHSPDTGVPQAIIGQGGTVVVTPETIDKMTAILDAAHERELSIGLVPIWAQHWRNNNGDGCFAVDDQIGTGPLQSWNADPFGRQVGAAFGDHPALAYWVLGGDNFCQASAGDMGDELDVWRTVAGAIRETGGGEPMTYHTPHSPGRGLQEVHTWLMDEAWVTFLSPQTGHCVTAEVAFEQLRALNTVSAKPIVAAEMRYETVPGVANFCGGTVGPTEAVEDARAAVDAGVAEVVFGHHRRYSWGADDGAGGRVPADGEFALGTLGSPTELALLEYMASVERD